ncbi:hypothetical protein BH20ACI1_BH20ACI1_29690 [soil metagenome]
MIFLISGCGKDESSNANISAANDQSAIVKNDNANIPKDDVEELDKIINLPMQPEDATWREDNLLDKQNNNNTPVPKGKKLTVVLKFTSEDAQKIVEQIDKTKPAFASDVDAASWFPPELIAKSQEFGDETLKGISYSADNFLRDPYKNGKITRINDTDFFVLELTSL